MPFLLETIIIVQVFQSENVKKHVLKTECRQHIYIGIYMYIYRKPLQVLYNVPGSTVDGQVDSFHYLDYVSLVFEWEREIEGRERKKGWRRTPTRLNVQFIQTETLQDPVDPCRFNIADGGQMQEREKYYVSSTNIMYDLLNKNFPLK